ncbi:efflux transporter outer membrane subunit [Pseudomonas protegens]|uniref:efflux transporter outer membrane subunit n=1 Tax=Pseudomonas protegens TaxID=380021 RepID=UPI00098D3471|nr:efflux transporter outer membrane subunit [Pseudomonas protegens]GED74225.1 RND transporter [Pseudomonas fluorescens]AQT09432.1 NodT family efflux transporter outer membrane factor lipoprotein [Pseudomonas protegens]MBF0641852.1 efflux transporter outer membrane subunit [Pseudomonas protegens]NAN54336.1 efflux transporter outer membrane subunit [Pseudomonas protegens]NUE78342.1 efflux transporter outer membrane subunit [Pseudomonas protegens]
MRPRLKPLAALLLLALHGCSLAPQYQVPPIDLPAHYREQSADGPWHPAAAPQVLAEQWWRLYQDPQLDDLQQRLLRANPDLAAALAHYDAAQAYASQLHAGLFPQISASAQPLRQRQSDSRPLRGSTQPSVYNSNTAGFALGLDLDLWGRIRNQAAAGDAQAQASGDDLAAARLSLQKQLASLYVQLNGLDAQSRILSHSLEDYAQALQLTRDRYQGQIASELDLTRAQSQLASAEAELDEVRAQRNLTEHAIGELVGEPASQFHLTPSAQLLSLPSIPRQLPSTLLQRRPDIAAAERRVYAANAGIGIARAAWYPDFSLTGMLGSQTQGVGNLLAAGNRYWALGPLVNLPIFDGGRLSANERQAHAEFEEAAAHYRGQVLRAVREVEDNLGQLRDLRQEALDQQATVNAAQHTQTLAMNSYQAGAVSYLDVVTAQTAALQAQRGLQAVQTRELQASVGLVVALGGGWNG